MSSPSHFYRQASYKRSSALVITLIVLLLVTLLVVSLSSMIGLERTATHGSFENQRAREFANLAVDEVVATLHDNIPATNIWAAAPGRLVAYTSLSTYTNISLCSGQAGGKTTSTGEVDLNAPVLGSSTATYPIIPINSEYTSATPMPMGWIEVLQDGTMIRPDPSGSSNSNKDSTNPVVGRYAYWVDTETSKVNINTAGKGEAAYTFDPYKLYNGTASNDLQNLTGSPSRVDLSQLDGNISTSQSVATYHYTYGGYWLGDAGDFMTTQVYSSIASPPGAPWPSVPTNGPGLTSQGMKRFSSIQEWAKMTNDNFPSAPVPNIPPITAAQIEQNKFYLTTRSTSPEVTPWGFNKMWLQVNNVKPALPSWLSPSKAWISTVGNGLNAKGVPLFPNSVTNAQAYAPGDGSSRGEASPDSDNRYYLTPYFTPIGTHATVDTTPKDFQFMGQYDGSMVRASTFINNMMVQLNRKDWPGFAGSSFVDKYGQAECEDLAFNVMCLYDSAIHEGGEAPQFYGFGEAGLDAFGYYGRSSKITIDGQSRLVSGVGEWPYIDEVQAIFHVGASNQGFVPDPRYGPSAYAATNIYKSASPAVTNTWITKYANRPGFAGSYVGNVAYYNIAIMPSVQVIYPAGFKNPYYTAASLFMTDIAVYAAGTGPFGTNALYGSMSPVDTENGTATNNLNHPYYWGLLDDLEKTPVTNLVTGVITTNSFYGPMAADTGPIAGLASVNNPYPIVGGNGTNSFITATFPTIYIGPFKQGTAIANVQMRCRFVLEAANSTTGKDPFEIIPLAYNAYNATANPEDYNYQNIMANAASPYTPTVNPAPAANYAPTFLFKIPSGSVLTMSAANGTYTANKYTVWNTSTAATNAYFLSDPRVYRYLTDWTSTNNGFTGLPPSGYVSSFTDPVTGVTGDDSKFAWPDMGLNYFSFNHYYYTGNQSGIVGDIRAYQTANNIQGFPGIGWLSVLPLNCESSQGTLASGTGSGDSNINGPIPWRTLSLEASRTTSTGVTLPDWLLLQAFSIAYDQTFASQTDGKINVNANISPQFPNGTTITPRLKPLQALIAPASSYVGTVDNPPMTSGNLTSITNAIASSSSSILGASLPSDIMMYPGQLAQLSAMNSGGTNQWQRESLMRNIAGTVTTQSSDFKVHVVAQAVRQVTYTGNPTTDFVVTGEQRMSAIVSRATNLGPDNIPDTGDEPSTGNPQTNVTINGVGTITTGVSNSLLVTIPPFKYVISDVNYINN